MSDNDTVYRTNPTTFVVEAHPRTTSWNSAPPPPNPVLRPYSPGVQQTIETRDNDIPENKHGEVQLGFIGSTGREKAEKAYVQLNDSAIARGILNPDGSVVVGREREAELVRLQLRTAKEAIAYEAVVKPALQEASDADTGAASESATEHALLKSQLSIANHDAARATARGDRFVQDRPLHERVVWINGSPVQVI